MNSRYLPHLFAFISVFVWGSTFISTKLLLHDLTPIQILWYRCVIAWLALVCIKPKFSFDFHLKSESLYFLASLLGVSTYFLFENYALQLTYASNASLIVTTSPIISSIVMCLFCKQNQFNKTCFVGMILSFFGVFLVIRESDSNMAIHPAGDFLALLAAFVWSLFAIALSRLNDDIEPIIRVRKIFSYSILTIAVVMLCSGKSFVSGYSLSVKNVSNILFLGVIASAVCYILWNQAVAKIGVSGTMIYMYFVPVTTMVMAYFILHERMSLMMVIGSVLVIFGVFIFNRYQGRVPA